MKMTKVGFPQALLLSLVLAGPLMGCGTGSVGGTTEPAPTLPSTPVATPPTTQAYSTPQSVSLTSTNATSIYYTINGSTPTCSSGSLYSAPITIAASTTINAIGCNTAGSSSVATFVFMITPPPTATLTASATSILTGGSGTLTIASTNTTGCTIPGIGTVTTNGTVPISPMATTTYTLTCTGPGGSSTPVSVTVTVTPVTITLTPPTVTLASGAQQQFTATVAGGITPAANFAATGGTITSAGLFTAPVIAAGLSPAVITVTATSVADTTKSATAAVTVNPVQPIGRTPPSGSWQLTGPNGGYITAFGVDPNVPSVVYTTSSYAGNGGLWKSTNSGSSWAPVITNTLIDQNAVSDIAIIGKTIYVALSGSYFFRSSDGGSTWTQSTVLYAQPIGAMAVDPTDTSTIYLSVPGKGVAKSTDGGNTWNILSGSPVITAKTITAILHNPLAVDPTSGTVYYGTDHGFYFSPDGGNSWTQGTGFASADVAFRDVAVSPADLTHIFALASSASSAVVNLYVSTNRGASWTPLAVSLDAERVVPDLQTTQTVYLFGLQTHAVYKSTNGGLAFSPSDSGIPSGSTSASVVLSGPTGALLFLPSTQTSLVSFGGNGVYQSQNAAQSWIFSSSGLSSWFGTAVTFDPEVPSTVYLGGLNGSGIFKSTNSGLTWSDSYIGSVTAIAVDPFNSSHILAADTTKGLIVSTDGGITWNVVTSLPTPTGSAFIVGIKFNPIQSGTSYISVRGGGQGVVESVNNGQSYFTTNTGLTTDQAISPVAVDPTNANILFVGTASGLFKSSDGGNTWALKTSDLFSLISIDGKTTTPVLYGSVGLYTGSSAKSLDLGETWQSLPSAPTLIVVDPSTANSLFSPTAWSPDGGATWQQLLTSGLGQISTLSANQFQGLTIAPTSPQNLYMTSSSNSVLRFAIGP